MHLGEAGQPTDTLGGMFSGMCVVPGSVRHVSDGSVSGELLALADRGFADGIVTYTPRFHRVGFTLAPGNSANAGTLELRLLATTLFAYRPDGDGTPLMNFRGGDPGQGPFAAETTRSWPSPPVLPFFDPEGITAAAGPAGQGIAFIYVSEEYGPSVYQFSADGVLMSVFERPASAIPQDKVPGPQAGVYRPCFGTRAEPEFGRRANRGLEGVTLTPDGKRLIGMMQGPLIQDGGADNAATVTRIYEWNADASSPEFGRLTGEYVTELPTYAIGKTGNRKAAPCSEVLAISQTMLLAIERDNLGNGADDDDAPLYKNINLISLAGANNLLQTPYAQGAGPGLAGKSLANFARGLSPGMVPAARTEIINMLEPTALAALGLNARGGTAAKPAAERPAGPTADSNTLPEKWEGLALIPASADAATSGEHYLFVGVDNDFKSPKVSFDGKVVGQSRFTVDSMVVVYKVRLDLPPKRTAGPKGTETDQPK